MFELLFGCQVIVVSAAIQRREKTKALLRQVAVLAPLSDLEMLTLADSFAEETYADGYTVCKQGEDGNDFYLIKEGLALCYQDDDETGEEVHFLRHRPLFVLNLTI